MVDAVRWRYPFRRQAKFVLVWKPASDLIQFGQTVACDQQQPSLTQKPRDGMNRTLPALRAEIDVGMPNNDKAKLSPAQR